MPLRNVIPLHHRGHSIFALLREFASDESGRLGGTRAKAVLSCDGETIEADVMVGEVATATVLPTRRPGVYIDGYDEDPWAGYTEDELRAIVDRDQVYRATRGVRPGRRAA